MALKTATCTMTATSRLTCMPRMIPATVTYPSRTPNAPVVVYNASMQRVAHLPNAFRIRFEKKINQVWNAWFYLPHDDVHAGECTVRRFVEIYDGSTRVGLFRIIDRKTRHLATRKVYLYECEHVLATLNDDMLVDVHNAGVTGQTTGAINYVLGRQDTIRWKLGTCGWSRNFLYRWENKTLLEALFEIPRRFGEDYQWTFDTTSYPWTINLISPSTTVAAYVDYGRNLQEITREEDARDLYTRLYAYGQGVQGSVAQISVRDANPTGMDYIDSDTIGTYGIITRVWIDQRYTSSQTLYDAAVEKLALRKTPLYRYTVKVADIHRLTGEGIDEFTLGAYVQITDSELGIEVSTRVVELSKPDSQGKPGQVTIQLANKMREFVDWTDVIYAPNLDDVTDGGAFARVLSTSIEAGVIKLSAIPGGIIGSFPTPPEIAGLYLGASYLGYHNGSVWKTYMDIAGKFRCEGTDAHLRWDPTGNGSLSIKGVVDIQSGSSLPSLIVDTAQIVDLAITTAKIDKLAVTDAKINNLDAGKITTGILSTITLDFATLTKQSLSVLNTELFGGITDDKIQSLDLDAVVAGHITSDFVVVNEDMNFHPAAVWHSITGCAYMEGYHSGTNIHSLTLGSASGTAVILKGGASAHLTLGITGDTTLRSQGQLVLYPGDGTIYWNNFVGGDVEFLGASTTGGQWGLGYINIKIGGVARSIAIESAH